MTIFLISIVVLGILGLLFAALLGLAAEKFHVQTDPRVETILTILPGSNCGACGSAGCHAFAEKLVKGEVAVSGCLLGGEDVAAKLAGVMGVEAGTVQKLVAVVHCGAKEDQRTKRARYAGVKTCAAAEIVGGGGLNCSWGCLGYGDCFCVCPFDAIRMKDGLPVIDPDKCTACGKCLVACPRLIISLRPKEFTVAVACSSRDKGAVVRKICPVGCIACKICEKELPEVFRVENNLALMDYNKVGANCDKAIAKCPTKCIADLAK